MKAKEQGQNKSSFVRSQPKTMSPAEVVVKAAEAGMKISVAYVYTIRSKARAAERKGGSSKRSSLGGLEQQFVNIALDMGFARAQELLDTARARARQAIG